MKEHVPKPYKPTGNLNFDQNHKIYYIVHYRILKFMCGWVWLFVKYIK